MIFTHIFMVALDHKVGLTTSPSFSSQVDRYYPTQPPSTIVLISGDVDYALPLSALALRGFKTILVAPNHVPVNEKLRGVVNHVFFWNDVLFPQSLVSSKSSSSLASPSISTSSSLGTDSTSLKSEKQLDFPVVVPPSPAPKKGQHAPTLLPTSTVPRSPIEVPLSSDEDTEVETLSEAGVDDHFKEFLNVLLDFAEKGDPNPLLSQVGTRFKEVNLSDFATHSQS